jgi:hypothetical protein
MNNPSETSADRFSQFAVDAMTLGMIVVTLGKAANKLQDSGRELLKYSDARYGEAETRQRFGPVAQRCAKVFELLIKWLEPSKKIYMSSVVAIQERGDNLDPRLSMQLSDSLGTMGELLASLTASLGLPITQWQMQCSAMKAGRADWPFIWRLGIRAGAAWHLVEDFFELHQAMGQLISFGQTMTSKWSTDTLTELGIPNAIRGHRAGRLSSQDSIKLAVFCSEQIVKFAQEARRKTEASVALADATRTARFLDAQDLIHLGIHSQTRHYGGVFLSHRGQDAKRPLMDNYADQRSRVFLDIWSPPQGDTNRRFPWCNLCACTEFHAFVTLHYAGSDFCMKEIESWGHAGMRAARRGRSTS